MEIPKRLELLKTHQCGLLQHAVAEPQYFHSKTPAESVCPLNITPLQLHTFLASALN